MTARTTTGRPWPDYARPMTLTLERAALVTLLRTATQPWHAYADAVELRASALAVLEEERGLLAHDGLDEASDQLADWERSGIRVLTVLDSDYPENLRAVSRPAAPDLRRRVAAPAGRTLGRRRRNARGHARGSRPRGPDSRAPRQPRLHGDLRTGGRDRHAGPHDGAAQRRPNRGGDRHWPASLSIRTRTARYSVGSPARAARSCHSSGPNRRRPQRAS